jgi:hypothetical protein
MWEGVWCLVLGLGGGMVEGQSGMQQALIQALEVRTGRGTSEGVCFSSLGCLSTSVYTPPLTPPQTCVKELRESNSSVDVASRS